LTGFLAIVLRTRHLIIADTFARRRRNLSTRLKWALRNVWTRSHDREAPVTRLTGDNHKNVEIPLILPQKCL